MSLADILEERASVLESVDDLTPEQSQQLEAYLEELAQEAGEKIDHFVSFRRECLDRAKAKEAEAKRLSEQARAITKKWEWMDAHYLSLMKQHGLNQIKGKAYTVGVRKSQRVAFSPNFDMAKLDENLKRMTVKIEPNKAELAKLLKDGKTFEGISLEEHWSLAVK